MKKKILLIGGYGFLGRWLIKSLSKENYDISVLDPKLNIKKLKQYNIQFYFKFSTSNNLKLQKALNKVRWDCVIYLAAWGGSGKGLLKAADENFKEAMQINVNNFRNILEEFKYNKKVKIIWSSSTVVFGEENDYKGKVTEKSRLHPSTNYGLTKVLAENITAYYIKNFEMNITGIRFPIIIGPELSYRGVASGISDMANFAKISKKSKIPMVSSPLDLIYIKDAVSILLKIINSNKKTNYIYNCPSFRTNAKKLADAFNKKINKKIITIKNLGIGATYPIMNSNLIKNDIKFTQKYNLNRTVSDWYESL